MIIAMLAAAAVTAAPPPPLAKPPAGPVAVCIWSKMPAYKDQVVGAPDLKTFKALREGYPEGSADEAFDACVPEGANEGAAETAFTYYEASLWAKRRLAGKHPEDKLATIDAIPEEDLQYFWLQPEGADAAWRQRRSEAWARAYAPFGRAGPAVVKDDLDALIVARVGWRLGEMDYAGGLARR
jgi:hypothetical protein